MWSFIKGVLERRRQEKQRQLDLQKAQEVAAAERRRIRTEAARVEYEEGVKRQQLQQLLLKNWTPTSPMLVREASDPPGRWNLSTNDRLARFYTDIHFLQITTKAFDKTNRSHLPPHLLETYEKILTGDLAAQKVWLDLAQKEIYETKLKMLLEGKVSEWDRYVSTHGNLPPPPRPSRPSPPPETYGQAMARGAKSGAITGAKVGAGLAASYLLSRRRR